MNNSRSGRSLVLSVCCVTGLVGCQSTEVKDPEPVPSPRSEWASFHPPEEPNEAKSFPNRIRLTAIDGIRIAGEESGSRFSCSERLCSLHPGAHEIGMTYVWSQTETKGEQLRKNVASVILAPLLIIGGEDPGAAFPLKNSRCDITITLDAQETRDYIPNIVHAVQKEQPDIVQILDSESGDVVASATPTCELLYETEFPFTNESAVGDQCAIHVFMGRDHRAGSLKFDIDGAQSQNASGRLAYTFIVNPGEHQISASVPRDSWGSSKRNIETHEVRCSAGNARYVQIDVEGFWTSRPKISDVSAEEIGPLISRVADKGRLHELASKK